MKGLGRALDERRSPCKGPKRGRVVCLGELAIDVLLRLGPTSEIIQVLGCVKAQTPVPVPEFLIQEVWVGA